MCGFLMMKWTFVGSIKKITQLSTALINLSRV